jgi:hypothetical protein
LENQIFNFLSGIKFQKIIIFSIKKSSTHPGHKSICLMSCWLDEKYFILSEKKSKSERERGKKIREMNEWMNRGRITSVMGSLPQLLFLHA